MRRLFKKRTLCGIMSAVLLVLLLMLMQTLILNSNAGAFTSDVHGYISVQNDAALERRNRFLNSVLLDNTTLPREACTKPARNIAFVKTHKAGSSTIANILQRYGLRHNLTFALPNSAYHVYGYNYISKPGEVLTKNKIIPLPSGKEYNILFNHAIYNRTAFREIMPANTSYITILREPFQQFVSAFEYYNVDKIFAVGNADIMNETNPISAYLANPVKYEKWVNYFSYIKNKQAEDLGLSRKEFFSSEKLQAYISQMDQDFTLVMILEYFDESLLLLKRLLCWETKDVLYIPKNKNRHKPDRNFTAEDYWRHSKMSHLDYTLYSHYHAIFKNRLKHLGEDFSQELAHFKTLLGHVKQGCTAHKFLSVGQTKWHGAFNVTDKDCSLMMMSELTVLDMLFARAGRAIRRPK